MKEFKLKRMNKICNKAIRFKVATQEDIENDKNRFANVEVYIDKEDGSLIIVPKEVEMEYRIEC